MQICQMVQGFIASCSSIASLIVRLILEKPYASFQPLNYFCTHLCYMTIFCIESQTQIEN